MPRTLPSHLPIAVLLVAVGACMSYRLSVPWVGNHDFASCLVSTLARNHQQYGFAQTKLIPFLRFDAEDPSARTVYSHRPPLFPVVLALAFGVLGATEASARLTIIAVSLGSRLTLYVLVSRLFGRRVGWLAAALFGIAPANLYFGRVVSLTQAIVLMILLTVCVYMRWCDSRRRRDLWILLAVLVVALLTNWQAYYLCLLLPAHHYLTAQGRPARGEMLLLLVAGPLVFGLFVVHLLSLHPGEARELIDTLEFRSGWMTAAKQLQFTGHVFQYDVITFARRMTDNLVTLIRAPLLLLAVASMMATAVQMWLPHENRQRLAAPWLLLGLAVGDTLVFHNAYYIHNYLVLLYLPALAVFGAISLAKLIEPALTFQHPIIAPAAGEESRTGRTAISRIADARVGVAVVLVLWFVAGSVVETRTWHARNEFSVVNLAHEIEKLTAPEEAVVLVGLTHHPAIEWYSGRHVYFLDQDGPIEEIMRRHRPKILALIRSTPAIVKGLKTTNPRRAEFLDARYSGAIQFAKRHARLVDESRDLIIFELPRQPPAVTSRRRNTRIEDTD